MTFTFHDENHFVAEDVSHLIYCDDSDIFVTDVSTFCDEMSVVTEANSIYDDWFWSLMNHHFRHNLPSAGRL